MTTAILTSRRICFPTPGTSAGRICFKSCNIPPPLLKMTFAASQNEDPINFSGLPWHIQNSILRKMNFKSYVNFVQTSKLAESLGNAERNANFQYHMDAEQIRIMENHVFINDGGILNYFSFEQCRKMKFPAIPVYVTDFLNEDICNFLLTLKEIPLLVIFFPEDEKEYVAEFLKKAKIGTLRIRTLFDNYNDAPQLPYDTSNIEKVELENCHALASHNLFAITAGRHLSIKDVFIRESEIFGYLENCASEKFQHDLSVFNYKISDQDFHRFIFYLHQCGKNMGNNTFGIFRSNQESPFMTIELKKEFIHFRRC